MQLSNPTQTTYDDLELLIELRALDDGVIEQIASGDAEIASEMIVPALPLLCLTARAITGPLTPGKSPCPNLSPQPWCEPAPTPEP